MHFLLCRCRVEGAGSSRALPSQRSPSLSALPAAERPYSPRGVQAPYVFDVYRGLRALGAAGFFTWSLEDSAAWAQRMPGQQQPPYYVETTLMAMP